MSEAEIVPDEEAIVEAAASEADAETEKSEAAGKRLAPETWAQIETHWECGTMTGAQICEHYDVSSTALKTHFKRHKILRGSKRHLMKKEAEVKIMGAVAAAEDPVAVAFEQKRKGRIAITRENNYILSSGVAARAVGIYKKINSGELTEAQAAADLKALRHFELLIKANTENRLRILKADGDVDEVNLPTLVFRDLTEEEIRAKQDADDEDDLGMPEEPVEVMDPEEDIIEEGE